MITAQDTTKTEALAIEVGYYETRRGYSIKPMPHKTNLTGGCPCDADCRMRQHCQAPCDTFNKWVNRGESGKGRM